MQISVTGGAPSKELRKEEADTIVKAIDECGHLYVTKQGYAAIHVYTNDKALMKLLASLFAFHIGTHNQVHDVVLSKRKHIKEFALMIDPYVSEEDSYVRKFIRACIAYGDSRSTDLARSLLARRAENCS